MPVPSKHETILFVGSGSETDNSYMEFSRNLIMGLIGMLSGNFGVENNFAYFGRLRRYLDRPNLWQL